MKYIIFLVIFGVCFAQANLRGYSEQQDTICSNPCENYMYDSLFPGVLIGQRVGYDGLNFTSVQMLNVINYCCDQQKTDKLIGSKYILPDFVDIYESGLPDLQTINATITNATKNENQTSDYKIEIVHQFQRRALNLSANQNQISLNITKANEIVQDLDNCNDNTLDWMVLFNFIGEELFSSQYIGVYVNTTVVFYSNQTNPEDYYTSRYYEFIQDHSIQDIENAFKSDELHSIQVLQSLTGGISYYYSKNWKTFLSQLKPQNYVYTKSHIPGHENELLYKSFLSYNIFNGFPDNTQKCAKKIWSFKFHKDISRIQLNLTTSQQ